MKNCQILLIKILRTKGWINSENKAQMIKPFFSYSKIEQSVVLFSFPMFHEWSPIWNPLEYVYILFFTQHGVETEEYTEILSKYIMWIFRM